MRDHVRLGTATAITISGLLVAGCAASHPSSSSSSSGPVGGAASANAPNSAPPATSPATTSGARSTDDGGGEGGGSGAAARPERCHTSQLDARVRMLDAAAGNRYAALILTNTSNASCRTFGYVGLQLTGATGTKLPTSVIRESAPGPHGVTLGPGKSAWTRIHWTVASGTGEPAAGLCEPQPSRLLVIPPDERTQLSARWPSGSVCEHGKIFVTALSLGTG